MIGPQPIADERQNVATAKLAKGMQLVCASVGAPFLDVFTPLHESTVWMDEVQSGDGAHPSAAGYAEFARIVLGSSPWRGWLGGVDR